MTVHMQACLVTGRLKTAALYLIVLQNLVAETVSGRVRGAHRRRARWAMSHVSMAWCWSGGPWECAGSNQAAGGDSAHRGL